MLLFIICTRMAIILYRITSSTRLLFHCLKEMCLHTICILILFVIVGTEVKPQNLMLARQVLYHLSQTPTLNEFAY
jgi:hypothetical protein